MKMNKDLKQLLSAPAVKFDGRSNMRYKPWAEALVREVQGLQL